MTYLLALDQGTSSSRSILFDDKGQLVANAQREITQHFPRPGWVEHDPAELWETQLATAREVLNKAGLQAHQVVALGITNQRETTVLWDRRTGAPLHRAIVWQDRRSEPICAQLREAGLAPAIREKTGLVVDAYFSGTKLRWLLDHVPQAQQLAEQGHVAFGTVDAWLMWQLTRGRVHATDVSNASRTMLFNIQRNEWDSELLHALNIPVSVLPQVKPSAALFGHTDADLLGSAVLIGGVAGDQQAALFGQGGFEPGAAKNTYGTGCFLLMHTGESFRRSTNGLVTTSAAQPNATPQFAMEGSVFVGGAVVQWLRDGLKAIEGSAQVQALAETVPDAGGVIMVPAFTGLGAPYWDAQARGTITGLTRGSTVAHIARAALESIAYQSAALFEAMSRDALASAATVVSELRVDGGACANDLLMQFQADLLGIPVVRPRVIETTALGAAYLAGLSARVFSDTAQLAALRSVERTFYPTMSREQAHDKMQQWDRAVRQTLVQ